MNKAFEKILERLEEKENESILKAPNTGDFNNPDYQKWMMKSFGFKESIKIVQEVAEEYKDGWIPCIERLPEDDSICIVTVEYPNKETVVDYGWFDKKGICWFVGMQEFRTSNILAWQPLPEPYEEHW